MSADANRARITALYEALARRDGEAMAACYTADARFDDPAFSLSGGEVGDMWRMLTHRGKDLRASVANIEADASSGRADWQAWYTFSGSGRPVHNVIHAEFEFRDGLICRHIDTFSMWRWSRQALGPAGLLLGWTPWLAGRVRREAAGGLAKFRAARRG
jgi:ketosteroid isomerase-like protein